MKIVGAPILKLVTSLLAILITIGICEVMARFFGIVSMPLTGGHILFAEKYFLIQDLCPSSKPTIFLVGDSAMHRSVYPDLLEALLKKNTIQARVINLAFDGARGDGVLCLLKTAVEKGIKPSLVLWNFSPDDVLLSKENGHINRSDMALIVKSHLGRCLLCKPHDFYGKLVCWLEKNCYLFCYRSQIKNSFSNFLQLVIKPQEYESAVLKPIANYTYEITQKGWNPNFELWSEDYYQRDLKSHKRDTIYSQSNIQADQESQFSLEKYKNGLAYCKAQQIEVCLVMLPFYSPLAGELFPDKNYNQAYEKVMEAVVAEKSISYTVIDGLNDNKKFFTDPRHPNILGAVATTSQLANKLSSEPRYEKLLKQKSEKNGEQ